MICDVGLVLEGGGMRGVFTAGVLDFLLDADYHFPYGIGVSAGAGHGLSFVSRQRGRAQRSSIEMLGKYRYIGWRHLLTKGSLFDMNLLYERLPCELLPYDFEACFSSTMRYEMVATNCLTGRAEYLSESASPERLLKICRASSSLPFLAPMVEINGIPMLDGGIVEAIPLPRAIEQGFERNVLVLTRNAGFRERGRDRRYPAWVYRRYPRLRVALSRIKRLRNERFDLIERLEAEGRVLVVRPEAPLQVGRLERNLQRLQELYDEGYACAERIFTSTKAKDFLLR